LAFHPQNNADPDPPYHVDVDPVQNSTFKFDANLDADPQHWI
jgi:hypothetical protein